jgi:hypothetical protein
MLETESTLAGTSTEEVNDKEGPLPGNIDIEKAIKEFEEMGCENSKKDVRSGGMHLDVIKALQNI